MKVLHLSSGGDIGGAKSHILALARELGKDCEIKLITFRSGHFFNDAIAAGIDSEVIHTGNFFADVRKLVEIIRAGKFDIVHSHGSKANMMSVAAKRRVDFISVSTIHSDYRHDYMHSRLRKYTFGVINRLALYKIDNYIAVSNVFKKMLTERKFKPSKIHTLYNGIDFNEPIKAFSKEDFHRKYNIPDLPGEIYVAIVARLHPVKDIPTFIRGAAEALKTVPAMRFLILGDGDQLHELESLASHLKIRDRVHFLGHVLEPYEILQNVHINTLTSLSESFPYVILEGARLSLPIVASNVGGLPAIITPMETGIFFEPGDHKSFGAALALLASDEELRKKIGANLYRRAFEHFSIQSMEKTQFEIYSRILRTRENVRNTGKIYDIAISGYYGYKNSGDDAILMAIVNSLRQVDPEIRIVVLSATPVDTSLALDVDSVMRFNLPRVNRTIGQSRLLVYGGGNLLQDDTSTRSLMYYLGILWLAQKKKTHTMLFAAGIGPITNSFNKHLSKIVVNKVDCITLRENLSFHELEALGVTKPRIEVTADPVLTIPVDSIIPPDSVFDFEGIPTGMRYAAISLREWSVSPAYERTLAEACDYLFEGYGMTPIFICMQYPDDIKVSERIAAKMRNKSYILRGKYSVSSMLSLISRTELMIGMRLHSLIYAASLAKPLIALPYEPKVEAFINTLEQPHLSAGDLSALTPETIKSLIDRVIKNQDEIVKHIENVYSVIRGKAHRNVEIVFELLQSGATLPGGKKDG